jgi:hypothetical protein
MDKEGVPFIGSYVKKGTPEFCAFDTNKNETKVLILILGSLS